MTGGAATLRPTEIRVPPQSLARYADLVDRAAYTDWRATIESAVDALRGRVVWHVNSTARGGGVAEMMGPQIGRREQTHTITSKARAPSKGPAWIL